MRRTFIFIYNFIIALTLIIISIPLQIIIALILFIELKENPFFIQERGITLSSGRFKMIKFKTVKNESIQKRPSAREFLKPIEENLVTNFARFLRKTGIDELPQLIHVLSGQMNIVGPRPLMIRDLEIMKEKFPNEYEKRSTLNLKPGITGLWQLYGDKSKSVESLIKYDLLYNQKKSFTDDLKIILSTIRYMFNVLKKLNAS
jgi:lipopolysaccharide/colanic/teichoic acid biosynthesis glycosyltransferase